MNILLISQCRKNALKETRRILDQFAERCGERSWQTAITEAGLNTLHRLLRKSARKNTAVACYWIHGKNHSSLRWIVGDRSQFNAQGRTPTHRSRRSSIVRETPWQHGASIQIAAVLAALLHDLGKASIAFQKKLRGAEKKADPYRHEWISLRLFLAMITGCNSDRTWLERLHDWQTWREAHPDWHKSILQTRKDYDLSALPPLAKWLAWLIVGHHRLPRYPVDYQRDRRQLQNPENDYLRIPAADYYRYLYPADGWLRDPKIPDHDDYWTLQADPTTDARWQKSLRRWTAKALNHPPLTQLCQETATIGEPLLLHLSRLCLMTGDHSYSAAAADSSATASPLYANTDNNGHLKQTLAEHLCGVATHSARIARELPAFARELPALANHRPFRSPTRIARYQWQNRAYDLACSLQSTSAEHGLFALNLASTGSGKTVANARIMSALADPAHGCRLTIALGLRILTLQTGAALRDKLQLTDNDNLATLVGGMTGELQQRHDDNGSESIAALLPDDTTFGDGDIDGHLPEAALGSTIREARARQLLATPIISCTIDHLMQTSEQQRGGHYIIPMLRLLSSDLILDEPDEFSEEDQPALSRLVHWAGLLGSRILLSSATITPAMAVALHRAYQEGRDQWRALQGLPPTPVIALWIDEHRQHSGQYRLDQYPDAHHKYSSQRATTLAAQPVRHRAALCDIDSTDALPQKLIDTATALHHTYHQTDPQSGKTLSLGLIRFANITPLMHTALALLARQPPPDTAIHLACYHARQLLIQRSRLEHRLDRIHNRHDPAALWHNPDIRTALSRHPARHHLCITLASPVCEVGRDHDYDWAIAEPSSIRALIQLAGRIWRHRPDKTLNDSANLYLWRYNYNALLHRDIAYHHPGYESAAHRLNSHDLAAITSTAEREHITAIPRLLEPEGDYRDSLSALEHHAITQTLGENSLSALYRRRDGAALLTAHHALITPFRAGRPEDDYRADWNSHYDSPEFYRQDASDSCNSEFNILNSLDIAAGNHLWLPSDLGNALNELAETQGEPPDALARRYATVSLPQYRDGSRWNYHPWGGFWHD